MIRAFCYPSGLIDFGATVPKGATVIARGPEPVLKPYIATKAQRGRDLRVPGMPQAQSVIEAQAALTRFCTWIGQNPPRGVRVLPR